VDGEGAAGLVRESAAIAKSPEGAVAVTAMAVWFCGVALV